MALQQTWRNLYQTVYKGLNYRLRHAAGGRWASHCRPTSIIILVTELCNARCVHCDIWKNKGREDTPTLDQWKQVLTDLRRWLGPVHVAFSGGEALLRPYTSELVAHGSAIGLYIEVLTHGYWDDQSKIEKLALARPSRVTVSLDGIGETHSRIRGRDKFWDKTTTSLETFRRVRKEHGCDYTIRLKTVVMEHNLDDLAGIARFAGEHEMEVFYQAIEQNYNTPEDVRWWEHTDNWPKNAEQAVSRIEELIALRRQGLPIANTESQLRVMIPYFRNPESLRLAVQNHMAHERKRGLSCSALTTLQLQANGDVKTCVSSPATGNVRTLPIRRIWEQRPQYWETGCCLERRADGSEKNLVSIASL